AELRAQAEQDRHQRCDVVGGRRVDPGRRHDADVLGVGGGRGATDGGGDHGADTVGGDGPAHVRVEVVLGHLLHGLDVTGVLRDERDDGGEDQQDGDDVEGRQVPSRDLGAVDDRGLGREAEPGRLGDAVEVDPEAGDDLTGAVRGGDLAEDPVEDP